MSDSPPPVSLFAWRPLLGILYRQVVLYRRSLPRWMEIFYWPLLDLLVWGFLTLYLKKIPSFLPSAVVSLLGALLLWDMLYRAQQGISVMFLEEIWSRNLIHLLVAPVTPYHIVFGAILSSFGKVLLSSMVAATLAYFLFSFKIFSSALILAPLAMRAVWTFFQKAEGAAFFMAFFMAFFLAGAFFVAGALAAPAAIAP